MFDYMNHKIGLFHLLAALKEGFKKGRGRIEKECQSPAQHPLLPNGSKKPRPILPNVEQKQREPPTVAVKPLLVSNDNSEDRIQLKSWQCHNHIGRKIRAAGSLWRHGGWSRWVHQLRCCVQLSSQITNLVSKTRDLTKNEVKDLLDMEKRSA